VATTSNVKRQKTEALSLVSLNSTDSSVHAVVRVTPPNLRVDKRIAEVIRAYRPTLAQHTCKQQGFGFFGDKLLGTTLPHLVEHLAIDFLVEDERLRGNRPPRPYAGMTTWLSREQGLMKIRLSHGGDGTVDTGSTGIAETAGIGATIDAAETTCAAITRAIALLNTLLAR
jgi:hypothetical protein